MHKRMQEEHRRYLVAVVQIAQEPDDKETKAMMVSENPCFCKTIHHHHRTGDLTPKSFACRYARCIYVSKIVAYVSYLIR